MISPYALLVFHHVFLHPSLFSIFSPVVLLCLPSILPPLSLSFALLPISSSFVSPNSPNR